MHRKRHLIKAVDLGSAVNGQFAEMFETISLCLILEGDEVVQRSIHPEGGRFCVRPGARPIWIEVGAGLPGVVHRSRPEMLTELALFSSGPGDQSRANAIRWSRDRGLAEKRASLMLASYASMSEMPGRHSVDTIMQWAPALEIPAYAAATSISALLDRERQQLFSNRPRGEQIAAAARRRHWKLVNLMGRLTILSTPPEARYWLSDMATSFEWISWTPTWPLLRERSLWLATVAARSAASFGVAMTDRYFEALGHARNPMKIFDALFGLSAIALGSRSHCNKILREMRRSIARLESRGALSEPTVRLAADQATEILQEPDAATQRSELALIEFGMRQSLFTTAILASDGANPSKLSGHPAFTALPFALESEVLRFFPMVNSRRAGLHLGLSDSDIKTLISRAWIGDTPELDITPPW
jgi:hypothetical protein